MLGSKHGLLEMVFLESWSGELRDLCPFPRAPPDYAEGIRSGVLAP